MFKFLLDPFGIFDDDDFIVFDEKVVNNNLKLDLSGLHFKPSTIALVGIGAGLIVTGLMMAVNEGSNNNKGKRK